MSEFLVDPPSTYPTLTDEEDNPHRQRLLVIV